MYGGVDFPIAFEPMRMDRTLRGMQIPRSKSQREPGAMVELKITKFRLKQEKFNDQKLDMRNRFFCKIYNNFEFYK